MLTMIDVPAAGTDIGVDFVNSFPIRKLKHVAHCYVDVDLAKVTALVPREHLLHKAQENLFQAVGLPPPTPPPPAYVDPTIGRCKC